ncbi:MAG: tetratricopeptide repeat protein [Bacteroidota bacterium]
MAAPKKKSTQKNLKTTKQKTVLLNKNENKFPLLIALSIAVATLIVYFRISSFDFVSWDDDQYILKNPYILSLSWDNIRSIFSEFHFANYHPLTTLTYAIDYQLYGFSSGGYHIENAILHSLNAFLVFYLFRLLTKKTNIAVIVSLLFAMHPMHVESVAWVSERKDVLYAFFFLISLIFYVRFLREKRGRLLVFSLLFFIASLMSKSAAVTLAPLLLIIDYFENRKFTWKVILEKVPFFLLSILFGVLTILSQQTTESISDLSINFSIPDRVFLFTYTIGFYFVKLIAPFQLSAMYYYPETTSGALPMIYYFSLPALMLLGYLLYRLKKYRKEIIFGILFFFISASVILQIIPVGFAITADRYTYIPYLGLFFILAVLADRLAQKKNRSMMVNGLVAAVLIVFTVLSFVRLNVWKNGFVLFTDVIEKNPKHFHGWWIRANMKANVDDWKGALEDYNQSLLYRPNFAFGLTNRGDVRIKLEDYKGALQDLNVAVMIDPVLPEAYNNRAMAHDGLGNKTAARKDYNMAIKLKPTMEKAWNNRGVLKAQQGDPQGALSDINHAIELNPKYAEAYSNLGNVKAMQKDFAGSVKEYDMALSLRPDDAMVLFNRGISKMSLKDNNAACADWSRAAELGHAEAATMKNQFCR